MTVTVKDRPYVLVFSNGRGNRYLASSEEAQRVIDAYPLVRATGDYVVVSGHETPDIQQRVHIIPATVGGGKAFEVQS